jgi:acyl carrier protein phosphodiesterase
MNYLAHLLLGQDSDDALAGSLLGDFVKGPLSAWPGPPAECAAIALHRAVDRWTDAHPIWQRSRARLAAPRSLAAGIVVDLAYDHLLAVHWDAHAPEPLASFSQRAYAALQARAPRLPPRLSSLLPHLVAEDWLGGYRDPESVIRAARGISRRLSRPEPLLAAARAWPAHYASVAADFAAFFPDLRAFATAQGGRAQWVDSGRCAAAPPP